MRGPEFVTQKIAQGLAAIKAGRQQHLELGNVEAKRDWGFAGDYVEAMWLMLQQTEPRDYVIATGITASVRTFASLVADALGLELEWRGDGATHKGKTIIRINPDLYRPTDVELLCGNARRAFDDMGWMPKTTLPQLASLMAKAAANG